MAEEEYKPPSEFLRALIQNADPLKADQTGRDTLARLIEMTRDPSPANRDWATFLIRQQGIDTPEVRQALFDAAEDEDEGVRAEAIRGLAEFDQARALPFVRKALASDMASAPIFEAAAIVADPSLIDDLRAFAEHSGDEYLDLLASEALAACEAQKQLQ